MKVDGTNLEIKTGGTLDPRRHVYVKRAEDAELLRLLLRREYCNVLTSRQMGKSSLMVQTVLKLREVGVKSVTIDMGGEMGTPAEARDWYIGLINKISRDLKLGLGIEEWWEGSGAGTHNQKLLEFFRERLVPSLKSPLVIFLDEIDSTLKLDYRDDLFTAIRTMYNERPVFNGYEDVTFCLLGVAVPNELIKDPLTTPYNIGQSISLRDFDLSRDDLSPLYAAVSESSEAGAEIVSEVIGWTGGQPYLTVWLCKKFVEQGKTSPGDVKGLIDGAFGSYDTAQAAEHFQEIGRFLTKRASDPVATLNLYSDIWRGAEVPDETKLSHVQLKLSGIVKRDHGGSLLVRNKIYRTLFTDQWVNDALLSLRPRGKSGRHVFISHAAKDNVFVGELRETLEAAGVEVWVDSRGPRKGSRLSPEAEAAIAEARQFIAVLSPHAVNTPSVRKEIKKALATENKRRDEGYRVIPLLLPGVTPVALRLLFDEEPVGVGVKVGADGVKDALPEILAALGERLPADLGATDRQTIEAVAARPVEELILRLGDLSMETEGGKRRVRAVAQLIHEPADQTARAVESRRYVFNAPLGPVETADLRWYLEEYFVWPVGVFKERAARIESSLPTWGQELYRAALGSQAALEALDAWQQAGAYGERRFSVLVDRELLEGAGEEAQAAADEAAATLLSLPWELLHDGRGFLFHGRYPVGVRRRLPNRHRQLTRPRPLPIRILFVNPRPETEDIGYFDHRLSALPLVESVESLGEMASLTVLTPPTFPALEETLRKAAAAGEPFDVVHFDGHSVYDPEAGLGALCFEEPADAEKLGERRPQLVHAGKLAGVIRDHGVQLAFLDSCKANSGEEHTAASISIRLLEEGVTSVVALSYGALIETTRRFARAFYQDLASGRRIGAAVLTGQEALMRDSSRGRIMGAGELYLTDWFVPVLYQEEYDPQLITSLPPEAIQQLQAQQRRHSLGALPTPPLHHFHGRSRELLSLERLLYREPWAVIRGQGGEGKTTLAAELARWMVRTGRLRRAAFVSLAQNTDARGVLDSLGRQLLPEGDAWSVANYPDLGQALRPVERALRDRPTIIVLDNLENLLPDSSGQTPPGAAPSRELFELCRRLLDADPRTRLVLTTRTPLPAPFDDRSREIALGALAREDAVRLVGEVMKQEGLTPKSDDPGTDPQEITDLVEAVGRHASALVLLAREVARRGVRATTENLNRLMAELHQKFPDDPENSLYASVELSLRRLPPESREMAKALAVFRGGAHLSVLLFVADAEPNAVVGLAQQLIEVGLAEYMGYEHLRLDPALPSYLLRGMGQDEQEELRGRWAAAMGRLTIFLSEQRAKDIELSSRLTLLELPNLLTMLRWLGERAAPETVVDLASKIEELLANLGQPQALAEATAARERAAQRLGEWGHARFSAERAEVERLVERGEMQAAYSAALQLLERSLAAGEEAYLGADYDLAVAHLNLGRVLEEGGAAGNALELLRESLRRFEKLAEAGDTNAARMASISLRDIAESLQELGRLDEAAATYEEAIRRAEALGDQRQVTVAKAQIGTVRLRQQRYAEALKLYEEARRTFESLGEPRSVAVVMHQVGMVYREMGQFEQAERAYRQSLAIKVQQKNLAGEASSLGELGILYRRWGQLEDAAKCLRQAADIYVGLKDDNHEGVVRNNLALTFLQMRQYDEARRELLRAIECQEPYGHAAELWKTWDILHRLEQASGNAAAAARARARAVESYLAYRRAGGQSMEPGAQVCAAAAQAIGRGETAALEQRLTELSGADVAPPVKVLFAKVQAVLHGERNPELADDPELDYRDAVELRLLLEAVAGGQAGR
ncbi:MAG: tetratricopeptide repeat protein [Acidobacteria bacterium]|nr:tetratricopeptide repeat protein [Acidobacteriota bacterium]